jgi:asparagine synthase (glutamine-hydrolysing)
MRRRGPDHQEFRRWNTDKDRSVYLLHSRLGIIDLDLRANQPMGRDHKWIALNGELYNYVELRDALVSDGVVFQTQSDTEVLLSILAQQGETALDRCEGMWAFALFDEGDGSLILCRDRFGEKPLYLYRCDDGIYFASEIKFISALLGRSLEINQEHLLRYLVNGYKSLYKGSNNFFKGVEELGAGSILKLTADGSEMTRKYWVPRFDQQVEMSFDDAVSGAREHLIRSVELRLRADVPLAFCMSGGVDSVALISIAKRVFNHDVHGFTIVNSDARYEEADMVECAVRELGLRHTAIPVTTTQFLPRLRELIRYHDAPVYTISYYVHWLLMKSIAEHGYKISVSGSAADELFSGYYDHHLAYLYDIRNDAALHAQSKKYWKSHILPIVRNKDLRNPDRYIAQPRIRDHIFDGVDEARSFLHKDWLEEFTEVNYTDSLMRNRMANELFHEAVPVILHEDDLNAMFFSIENRSPFLDRNLFDFCNSVPSRHLIQEGRAKAILREAVRGIAPDAIIENRRKVGFNAPIFSLLDVRDNAVRKELLADSPIFSVIRRDRIQEMLDQTDLSNSASKFLFNFICAKIFIEEFGDVSSSGNASGATA